MKEVADSMVDHLRITLLNGDPPLYLQLALATIAFIIVRLWQHMHERRQRQRGLVPVNDIRFVTVSYFAVMLALSMGAWQKLEHFFENYVVVAFARLV